MKTNPELSQDRVFDTCDHFRTFDLIMFRQQRRIYENLAERCRGMTVLEAGCGAGIGAAMLERSAKSFRATDKEERNIRFARELYPWIEFSVWDITQASNLTADAVVCVEAIEHIAEVLSALRNLLAAAKRELWLSTPNGNYKADPLSNPYHVREYSVSEMLDFLRSVGFPTIDILHWDTLEQLSMDTNVDPLIYRVLL